MLVVLDRPASVEEDLPPLAALHDLLRKAGLARLAHGTLTPTKAAADDRQIIRKLRQALEPDSFHDLLIGVTTAHLAAHGPATTEHLAETAMPWRDRWAANGRPITTNDIRRELHHTGPTMQALDLVERDWTTPTDTWHAGPAATTSSAAPPPWPTTGVSTPPQPPDRTGTGREARMTSSRVPVGRHGVPSRSTGA